MTTSKPEPHFEHDCERCVFLGHVESSGNPNGADLYYCNTSSRPTVIARYSGKGPDYISGLHDGICTGDLVVAAVRAVKYLQDKFDAIERTLLERSAPKCDGTGSTCPKCIVGRGCRYYGG